MSAPDILRQTLEPFEALADGANLTVVLGAGASVPSGLPSWDDFATKVSTGSGLVGTEEAARVLLGKQDPTIVLEAAQAKAGERWEKLVFDALFGDAPEAYDPSPVHLAAAQYFSDSPERVTLATLNFDTLLERAVLASGKSAVAIGLYGVETEGIPTVHHLHGAAFDGGLHSAVIGYGDFAELVADSDPWQFRFLRDALRKGPLILAGTSYRDPDIRHWLHLIMRDDAPKYPALVTIAREGLKLDREAYAELEEALVFEWESIGLKALPMQDLSDVARILRELPALRRSGYLSPNERAKALWKRHRLRIRRLQPEYSKLLIRDTKRISDRLGTSAHRSALWLANGRGGLGRWASGGAVQSRVSELKIVPTGYDSAWIAGEALATETVKLKDVTRENGVRPIWRSVLAIPIFVEDGIAPPFAAAVLTFGLSAGASTLLESSEAWTALVEQMSLEWGERLSSVAFPR